MYRETLARACNYWLAFLQRFETCSLKVNLLSVVIPSDVLLLLLLVILYWPTFTDKFVLESPIGDWCVSDCIPTRTNGRLLSKPMEDIPISMLLNKKAALLACFE